MAKSVPTLFEEYHDLLQRYATIAEERHTETQKRKECERESSEKLLKALAKKIPNPKRINKLKASNEADSKEHYVALGKLEKRTTKVRASLYKKIDKIGNALFPNSSAPFVSAFKAFVGAIEQMIDASAQCHCSNRDWGVCTYSTRIRSTKEQAIDAQRRLLTSVEFKGPASAEKIGQAWNDYAACLGQTIVDGGLDFSLCSESLGELADTLETELLTEKETKGEDEDDDDEKSEEEEWTYPVFLYP